MMAPGETAAFASLLAELRSLGRRSGSVIEDVYARVAGSFLGRLERIEDAIAERRLRQRSSLGASGGTHVPRQLPRTDESLPAAN